MNIKEKLQAKSKETKYIVIMSPFGCDHQVGVMTKDEILEYIEEGYTKVSVDKFENHGLDENQLVVFDYVPAKLKLVLTLE